jgi:hypothetical protein
VYLWNQQAGPTVFAPFEKDSDYFAADKPFMLNLRVDDLAGMLPRVASTCDRRRGSLSANPGRSRAHPRYHRLDAHGSTCF